MDDYFINIDLNTEEGRASFINEIVRIKSSAQSAETKLNLLNLLIRDFLRKRFHTKKNEEYSEMIEYFLAKNKPNIAIFCNEMVKHLYAGESAEQSAVIGLLDDAKTMIQKELYGSSPSEKKPKINIFSSIFNKFNKKEKIQKNFNPKIVSKQTEKIIEKTLLPEQSIKIDENSQHEAEENESTDRVRLIDSIRTRLNLTLSPKDALPLTEEENHQSIEGIDNLERIKQKVRIKKIIYAQQQAQKRAQEQTPQQNT